MSRVRPIARAATLCLILLGAGASTAAAADDAAPRWTVEERPAGGGAPAITFATDATTGEQQAVKYDGGALGTIWLSDCDDPVRNPAGTAAGALAGDKPACRFARAAGDGNAEGDGDWLAASAVSAVFGGSIAADVILEARRSPDGAHLLVWVGGDATDAVWVARADGSQPRLLALGENVVLHRIRWTAAGGAQFTYQVGWGALRTATSTVTAASGIDTWSTADPPLAPDASDEGVRFDVLHGVTLDGAAGIADIAVERATGKRFVIRTWTPAGIGKPATAAWASDCGDAARNPGGTARGAVRGAAPACTFARTEVPADPKPGDPKPEDPKPTAPTTPSTPQQPQGEVRPPVTTPAPARVKLIAVGTKLGGRKKNLLTVKFAALEGKGLRIQLVLSGKGGKAAAVLVRVLLTAEQAKAGTIRLQLSKSAVKKVRAAGGKGLSVQLAALTADAKPLS